MRDVAVTEGDKVEAELRFGVSVNTYGVNDLVAVVDAVDEGAVDELVKEYDDRYRVVAALRPGGERHASLRYAARIEAGLRDFLVAGGFQAFTTNFEDLGGLRQLPGLAVQRLMAEGYGFGGEGDWKTSVLVHTLKAMADGGTSFMEDYTYDLTPAGNWSSGPTCSRCARASPPRRRRWRSTHCRSAAERIPSASCSTPRPARRSSSVWPNLGDRFRLVANEVDVVAPPQPLPRLPVARAVWRPRPDLPRSAEAWITAGAPHHTVLSSAVGVEELTDLAGMIRTELVLIYADTTPRRFADELRWNQAYHRLARGF